MEGEPALKFRGIAARLNYLAQDRVDILFAAKEACRGMAAPTRGDVKRLRRLVRYLITHPRCVACFPWQARADTLVACSDSD